MDLKKLASEAGLGKALPAMVVDLDGSLESTSTDGRFYNCRYPLICFQTLHLIIILLFKPKQ